MRYSVLAVLTLSLVGTAFAQNRGPYWSLGGFGNVLYPGTGHAPSTPPGGVTGPNFGSRLNGVRNVFPNPIQANHPQHGRTLIVPYPVYYGGTTGYDAPQQGYADPEQLPPVINGGNGVPSVVINQNFIPPQANPSVRDYAPGDITTDQQSGMRLYQAPSHPYADVADSSATRRRMTANGDDQPTIYLLAFKDHGIVQALGYWMEGGALHYVSAEHSLNQVSIDLLDRDLSQRLNDERGVEFKLPTR
jgi:hypothetical protein